MNPKQLVLTALVALITLTGTVGCIDQIREAKKHIAESGITDIAIDVAARDVLEAIATPDTKASRIAGRALEIYIDDAPDGLRHAAQQRYGVQLAPADWTCTPPATP